MTAFANKRGGAIVVGVKTERRPTELVEAAIAIRPVRKAVVDLQQHRGVIDAWIYPRLEGVDFRWYPPDTNEPRGVLLIDIPAQEEAKVPFILREMCEPNSAFGGAVGIPRRDGERVVWDTAQDLHRQITRGRAGPAVARGPVGPALQRATGRVAVVEQFQGWEADPVFFLQALPPPGPETLPDFYDAFRESLINHPVLRPGGFAGRWRLQAQALEGGWVARTSDGLTWLEPDGLLTQGLLASEDSNLGWYYNQDRTEGKPLVLNPVAVVESTLEFFRFLYAEVRPRAGRGIWQYRLSCRRFRSNAIALPTGRPAREFLLVTGGDPPLASADDWERVCEEVGSASRDAFEVLQHFYALFGHPPKSIPLVENDAVAEAQLLELRG